MEKPTVIDLNLGELRYRTFKINLDKCDENCDTLDDLLDRLCVTD